MYIFYAGPRNQHHRFNSPLCGPRTYGRSSLHLSARNGGNPVPGVNRLRAIAIGGWQVFKRKPNPPPYPSITNIHIQFFYFKPQPQPIVDTIQEHEKYGNSGDKFYPIGRAIVNTYEGFSNLLNRILDAPLELAKKASRGLTGTLNSVGGKLVGL